jgi:hypothetical protein
VRPVSVSVKRARTGMADRGVSPCQTRGHVRSSAVAPKRRTRDTAHALASAPC